MNLLDESGVPAYPINSRNYIGRGPVGCDRAVLRPHLLHRPQRAGAGAHRQLKCIGMLPAARGLRKGRVGKSYPVPEQKGDRSGFSESVRLLRIRIEKELHRQGNDMLPYGRQ